MNVSVGTWVRGSGQLKVAMNADEDHELQLPGLKALCEVESLYTIFSFSSHVSPNIEKWNAYIKSTDGLTRSLAVAQDDVLGELGRCLRRPDGNDYERLYLSSLNCDLRSWPVIPILFLGVLAGYAAHKMAFFGTRDCAVDTFERSQNQQNDQPRETARDLELTEQL